MEKLKVLDASGGKGPTGLPNHWAVAPVYIDGETGEVWVDEERFRSVPPGLGRKLVKMGAMRKIGEIEVTDPRSLNQPTAKWSDMEPRKKIEAAKKSKAAKASAAPKAEKVGAS